MASVNNIKTIFDEIKQAIIDQGVEVADCDSPETYASKIRAISNNNAQIITINAFKSSETTPSTPTGGTYGTDIVYPDGWSNGYGLTDNIWMSTGYITPNETVWTPPVRLETSKSINISTQNNTRTFMVFTLQGDDNIEPETPVGGHWNTETNTLEEDDITSNDGHYTWSTNAGRGNKYWMSQGTFGYDGNQIGTWSVPLCLGKNGADGNSVEFVYKRFHNENEFNLHIDDDISCSGDCGDGCVPSGGWRSEPQGIDPDEWKVEAIVSRVKRDGVWGDWGKPVIWSVWGKAGTDGDGVEYIFARTTSAVLDPTSTNKLDRMYWPDANWDYDDPGEVNGVEWTDDPGTLDDVEGDVDDTTLLYQWVCIRRSKNGEFAGQEWSEPAIWQNNNSISNITQTTNEITLSINTLTSDLQTAGITLNGDQSRITLNANNIVFDGAESLNEHIKNTAQVIVNGSLTANSVKAGSLLATGNNGTVNIEDGKITILGNNNRSGIRITVGDVEKDNELISIPRIEFLDKDGNVAYTIDGENGYVTVEGQTYYTGEEWDPFTFINYTYITASVINKLFDENEFDKTSTWNTIEGYIRKMDIDNPKQKLYTYTPKSKKVTDGSSSTMYYWADAENNVAYRGYTLSSEDQTFINNKSEGGITKSILIVSTQHLFDDLGIDIELSDDQYSTSGNYLQPLYMYTITSTPGRNSTGSGGKYVNGPLKDSFSIRAVSRYWINCFEGDVRYDSYTPD